MFQPKEIGYFKRILRETEVQGVKLITAPSPTQVIEAAAKQVMYRLDGVDAEVRKYFTPVAKMLLSSRDPQEALEVGPCLWFCACRTFCSRLLAGNAAAGLLACLLEGGRELSRVLLTDPRLHSCLPPSPWSCPCRQRWRR